MPVTGTSAVGFGALGMVTDPALSAFRVTQAFDGNYNGGYLLSGQNISGTGLALDARGMQGIYGGGFYTLRCSGNSASAAFYVSRDSANWMLLTATAMASGTTTALGQWSGYYPYILGVAPWVSASTSGTGTIWLTLDLQG